VKVLITGSSGLVGRALEKHCIDAGDTVKAYDHAALDIADFNMVDREVSRQRPDVLINCAAWTDVDGCETNPERSFRDNALGPHNLARACRKTDAGFVTISTDYVFDGANEGFYTQRDTPEPLSVYGKDKLIGERLVQSGYGRSIVVRTGFIFGIGGRNFLSRVIELATQGRELSAISDARGTPTYAKDLAVRLRELALRDVPGVYHVVNAGDGATYEEFTRTALEFAKIRTDIHVVSMNSLKRPAPRPANSRLKCLLTGAIGLEPLPNWKESLKRFVAEMVLDRAQNTNA